MSVTIRTGLIIAVLLTSCRQLLLAVEPIDIGHDWQLLLDDHVVARSTGLDRVLHHPRPRGVVVPADKPWETYGVELLYGTPVGRRDDGTFYMFYRAMWWDPGVTEQLKVENAGLAKSDRAHHMRFSTGYATSQDGIHWNKPSLGLTAAPATIKKVGHWTYSEGETRENNIGVPLMDPVDLATHGNVSDPQKRFLFRVIPDPTDPSQQAPSTVVGAQWEAFFSPTIPDFQSDAQWREKLTSTGSALNPRRHFVNFWDDQHQEWVALEQGIVGHWIPSREIARFASKDLKDWTAEAALYPDSADLHSLDRYDEPMTLHPYYTDGVVLGLLSWFHSDRTDPDGGPILTPTDEHPFRWPWARKGICDTRITISRDGGKTWDRTVSREPWIACSTNEHAYDRQAFRPAPPVRVGDEDWFYVTMMNGNHLVIRNNPGQDSYYHERVVKMEIALYTQSHLRFVSMRAGAAKPEVLITKPVVFDGGQLQLNVDASHGSVRVAIASPEGQMATLSGGVTIPVYAPHLATPLEGYSFDDCEPILANDIDHPVEFKSGKGLEELSGKPVLLIFEMKDADLFGFRVGPSYAKE